MTDSIAISIKDVSKSYFIDKQTDGTFVQTLSQIFNHKKSEKIVFWALKDISFDINKGEVVGIVGKNGAGKSTLLKILSQITKPSTGRIEINGRVASLLEVGTGFHPELTGRENIFLNGTILGMTRQEVKSKFNEIVAFSGINEFIDTPVKHYSSGMSVRLAFSVAAHLDPEILIIDEVLAVGDAEFQKKCIGKMQDVSSEGRTVLFVSHNMAAVKSLCHKGILINNGKVEYFGDINDTLKLYLKSTENQAIYIPKEIVRNEEVAFKKIWVTNCNEDLCSDFTIEEKILIHFEFEVYNSYHLYSLFVIFKDKYGAPVFSAEKKIKDSILCLQIDNNFLTRGNYSIHTFIHIPKIRQIDIAKDICSFNITDATSPLSIHGNYEYGNVFGNYHWITK